MTQCHKRSRALHSNDGRHAQDRDSRRRPDRRVAHLRAALVRLAGARRSRGDRASHRARRRASRALRCRSDAFEPRRCGRRVTRRHRRQAPGHRGPPGRDRHAHPSRADRALGRGSDPDVPDREPALRPGTRRARDAEHAVDGARGDRRALAGAHAGDEHLDLAEEALSHLGAVVRVPERLSTRSPPSRARAPRTSRCSPRR